MAKGLGADSCNQGAPRSAFNPREDGKRGAYQGEGLGEAEGVLVLENEGYY